MPPILDSRREVGALDFSIEIWGHNMTSDILEGQLDLESRGVSWAQLEGKALSLGLRGSVV